MCMLYARQSAAAYPSRATGALELLCATRGNGGATCFAICLADAVQKLGTIDRRCTESGAYHLPESSQDFVSR